MGQLRSDEIVCYVTINGEALPLLNVAGVPEPDVDEQTYPRPLKNGMFSAGGKTSYGTIEAWTIYDPDAHEDHKARMQGLQGIGTGQAAFHAAPGMVPSLRPIKGETYQVTLLKCYLSDGQDAEGGSITQLNYEFSVSGVGA